MPEMTRKSGSYLTPVLMAGLVVALPLAMSTPVSLSSARPNVVSDSQQRAESLVRCVSEAARQFCHAPVATFTPTFYDDELKPLGVDAVCLTDRTPTPLALTRPSLIDLPPPTC